MSITIKYKNFTGEITAQQVTQLNDNYDKIYYLNDIKRKEESINKDGNINSVRFFILPSENEVDILQQLTQEYSNVKQFFITIRTPVGSYFRERERDFLMMANLEKNMNW